MKVLKIVGVIACLWFIIAAFEAAANKDTTAPAASVEPILANVDVSDRLPDNLRKQFMDGCVGKDATQSYCECVLGKMDAQYTNKQLIAQFAAYSNKVDDTDNMTAEDYEALPDFMMNAVIECTE